MQKTFIRFNNISVNGEKKTKKNNFKNNSANYLLMWSSRLF